MQPVRIALVGCGFIAEKHVRSMLELGSAAELVALCDIYKQNMESFRDKTCLPYYPKVSLYTNIDDCLRRSDIDLVVITTSTNTHASLTLAALEAGKHVLVEKPLALSMRDARKAAAAAKRRNLILAVALQTRYLSQIQAVKKAVDEGRFGRFIHGVVSMRWHRSMDYYRSSPWRDSWARGGGLFMNQCIHYIDLLLWLMGPAASVYGDADSFIQPLNVENMGAALLKFADGASGLIEASAFVHPQNQSTSISLFGEHGSVILEGRRLNEIRHWSFESDGSDDMNIPIRMDDISHTPLYKDLLCAVKTGAPPLVSVETSLHSLEVVLAIYQSIVKGKRIKLPAPPFDMKNMTDKEERRDPC